MLCLKRTVIDQGDKESVGYDERKGGKTDEK